MLKNNRKIAIIVALMALMAVAVVSVSAGGFKSEPVFELDGGSYIIKPIPGHVWNQAGPNQAVGKHYNTGPAWAPTKWWSPDADDGELLYIVHGIVDDWTAEKAAQYAARGYVHYHELITNDANKTEHPTMVIWLRHTARTSFTFDGGPHPEHPARPVTPGVDHHFLPNGGMPYPPQS
jgi:hypothetical protein